MNFSILITNNCNFLRSNFILTSEFSLDFLSIPIDDHQINPSDFSTIDNLVDKNLTFFPIRRFFLFQKNVWIKRNRLGNSEVQKYTRGIVK